ncbi:NUDIX domain-containing protein [Candidatus Pacearchaeota archaeon]|nr:NUDIX domain-containing protein [Candidatus Pacearchaeota archaeon]
MERPKVGVGAIIRRNGKVLLSKRKNTHGEGSWSFAGGHLEFKETPEECAAREAMEETGITIKNQYIAALTNDIFEKEGKHYITIFVVSDYESGEVVLKEPEVAEEWGWFSWDSLPQPLFMPIQNLLKQKFNPFKQQARISSMQEQIQ